MKTAGAVLVIALTSMIIGANPGFVFASENALERSGAAEARDVAATVVPTGAPERRPAIVFAGAREDALEALKDKDDVEGRRQAVRTLHDAGTMADTPLLVQALRDTDEAVRILAEQALWEVWSRSGNQEIDRLFETGTHAMTEGRWDEAVDAFTHIIRRDPAFAEGWNKRATVYFLMGQYDKSLADCDEVIKRNPQHFGALSGYGMIYLRLDQPTKALSYFERALTVNPNMEGVKNAVEVLRARLREQRKNAI